MDENTFIYDQLRKCHGGSLSNGVFAAAKRIVESEYRKDLIVALGLNEATQADEKYLHGKGADLIQSFESFRANPYLDAASPPVPTIGWGTTVYPSGKRVTMADAPVTRAEAEAFFSRDVKQFEAAVNKAIKVPITQNQFDALVSLVYNIGGHAFAVTGTIPAKINAGNWDAAYKTWAQYVNAGANKNVAGLVRRRKAEIELAKS